MTEPTHSPLPWRKDKMDQIFDAEGRLVASFYGAGVLRDGQNGELVLRAVNRDAAVEELLRAANSVSQLSLWLEDGFDLDAAKAIAALDKAIAGMEAPNNGGAHDGVKS